MKPTNKVTAAVTAAAATTVGVWILSTAGIIIPGEVQGAITTLLVAGAGYFTRDNTTGKHEADE